ncbi:hypothetical protein D3C81_1591610 [compost metagenome]
MIAKQTLMHSFIGCSHQVFARHHSSLQPRCKMIQPLCVLDQASLRLKQRRRFLQTTKSFTRLRQAVLQPSLQHLLGLAELSLKLRHMRHGELCRRCWRCCPQVADKIGDRKIRLMAYGRYNRNFRFIDRPCDLFLIERPQLL